MFPTFFLFTCMKSTIAPIAISFALGIFFAHTLLPASAVWWAVVAAVALAVAVLPIASSRSSFLFRHPSCQLLMLLPIAASGTVAALVQTNTNKPYYPEKADKYDIIIMSESSEKRNLITTEAIITTGPFAGKKIDAKFSRDIFVNALPHPGHGFQIYGKLTKPNDSKTSNYSYSRQLQTRGIYHTIFIAKGNCLPKTVSLDGLSLLQQARLGALKLRHSAIETYRKAGLYGDVLAIVSAMSLGDKSKVSKDLYDNYSNTGAAHILALSGTHLTIMFLLLSFLLTHYARKWYGMALLLCLIWTYVFFTGMSSSLLRSALMLTVLSISDLSSRGRNRVNSLSIAAMLIMLDNPIAVFDIGFQLSVAAVFAIVAMFPIIQLKKRLTINKREHYLLKYLCHPLFNYLFFNLLIFLLTTPLIAYYFGRIPTYFLLSNLIIVPSATIILYLSAATLLLSFLPFAPQATAWLLNIGINAINYVLATLASLPLPYISISKMSLFTLFLSYLPVILVWKLICVIKHR